MFKSVFFLFLFFLISCRQTPEGILIDLSDNRTAIYYSDFVDSVSYVKLDTYDSCLISGIDGIYVDSNYCIMRDDRGDGIFIFRDHKLAGHLNNFGRGPQEFARIIRFCLDKYADNICIHDDINKKVLKYTYDGEFIDEYPFQLIIRDFGVAEDKKIVCIIPYYVSYTECGVWLADSNGNFLKKLYQVSEDDRLELSSSLGYFQGKDYLIYYDRYKDWMIKITPDSTQVLYKFNLKQALPKKMKQNPDQDFVSGFFLEWGFFYTDRYLLLGFFSLDKNYRVLYDTKTGEMKVAEKLINDLDDRKPLSAPIGYMRDNVLIAPLQASEDDCNIYLQLLHVKK